MIVQSIFKLFDLLLVFLFKKRTRCTWLLNISNFIKFHRFPQKYRMRWWNEESKHQQIKNYWKGHNVLHITVKSLLGGVSSVVPHGSSWGPLLFLFYLISMTPCLVVDLYSRIWFPIPFRKTKVSEGRWVCAIKILNQYFNTSLWERKKKL